MPPVNRVVMYSVILVLMFIQITLLGYISIAGYSPDLMLAAVIFLAVFFGSKTGFEAGIAAGIGKDLLTFDYMGMNTLVLAITGLVIGSLNSKFFKESKIARFVIVFFFSAFSMSVHLFIYGAITPSRDIRFLDYAASPILPVSLYTALVALPLFSILENLFRVGEMPDII